MDSVKVSDEDPDRAPVNGCLHQLVPLVDEPKPLVNRHLSS